MCSGGGNNDVLRGGYLSKTVGRAAAAAGAAALDVDADIATICDERAFRGMH